MKAAIPFASAAAFIIMTGCQSRPCPAPDCFRWGVALEGFPIEPERLESVRRDLGVNPQIVAFFLAWPDDGSTTGCFPLSTLAAISDSGAMPCLTWEPMFVKDGVETAIPAEVLLSGRHDLFLADFAAYAARWGRPFIIRFAHEMNLARYHWGGEASEYGPDSPLLYRQMFRYVVGRFREAGATNVLWAFCPNAESVPNADWNRIAAYYPGDDVVDYLGMDGYDWGNSRSTQKHGWESQRRSFRQIFGQTRDELRRINSEKPLFVFETATVGDPEHQRMWLAEAMKACADWQIAGLVWFHASKENDWRLSRESAVIFGDLVNEWCGCTGKIRRQRADR